MRPVPLLLQLDSCRVWRGRGARALKRTGQTHSSGSSLERCTGLAICQAPEQTVSWRVATRVCKAVLNRPHRVPVRKLVIYSGLWLSRSSSSVAGARRVRLHNQWRGADVRGGGGRPGGRRACGGSHGARVHIGGGPGCELSARRAPGPGGRAACAVVRTRSPVAGGVFLGWWLQRTHSASRRPAHALKRVLFHLL